MIEERNPMPLDVYCKIVTDECKKLREENKLLLEERRLLVDTNKELVDTCSKREEEVKAFQLSLAKLNVRCREMETNYLGELKKKECLKKILNDIYSLIMGKENINASQYQSTERRI